MFRVIDANLNRAREGLRVCEEVARFVLNDSRLTRRCQQLRYQINTLAKKFSKRKLLENRDSRRDVGRPAERVSAGKHRGYPDLVRANALRAQEALRVLEEFTRLKSLSISKEFGSVRFRVYSLEQELLAKLPPVYNR